MFRPASRLLAACLVARHDAPHRAEDLRQPPREKPSDASATPLRRAPFPPRPSSPALRRDKLRPRHSRREHAAGERPRHHPPARRAIGPHHVARRPVHERTLQLRHGRASSTQTPCPPFAASKRSSIPRSPRARAPPRRAAPARGAPSRVVRLFPSPSISLQDIKSRGACSVHIDGGQ